MFLPRSVISQLGAGVSLPLSGASLVNDWTSFTLRVSFKIIYFISQGFNRMELFP